MHSRLEVDMLLRDIMSTRVETVRRGDTLERAQKRMQKRGIHHLVVAYRGRVVGLLSAAEVEARIAADVARVEDGMFRQVVVAPPDMNVTEAARVMRGRPEGALLVAAGRRLAGIVTISDLLDVLGRCTVRPKIQVRQPKQRAS
jgi:CBS domain-containing protein